MQSYTIFLLAIGLAMDAFAVSISCGICDKNNPFKNAFKVSIFFGFFQGGMTAIGWFLGSSVKEYIERIDYIVALILLCAIGIKMIQESLDTSCECINLTSTKMLITLSIATSIDALAAGISLSSLKAPIIFPSITIGIITFTLSFMGVIIGARIGCTEKFKKNIDLLGGIILIFIGLKIFIQHFTNTF